MSLLEILLLEAVVALLAALLAVRWTLLGPMERLTRWLHNVGSGQATEPPDPPRRGPLAPLAEEAETLARNLSQARAIAIEEARLRNSAEALWTAERLREHVRAKLRERPLVVISNREPYRHVRAGGKTECVVPASGLVTGLEPLLRACGGTWIAHGDGDADREQSDESGRLGVPPDSPQYTLQRVWLDKGEVEGYYDGFANEGLWPLCHIAHTRPVFRPEDWDAYREVNEKFARAVLAEIEGKEEPFVLVQDYHFTLLPALVKARRPDARIALFWHIPWPTPEVFGICPWSESLLEGMLGADLIGFHTQHLCNNFLDTADTFLECRIDRERFGVERRDHTTLVKPFPISVAFPAPTEAFPDREAERLRLRAEHGVQARFLAVGVDRLDYTKGILERFRGVERFLDRYPRYRGQFALLQVGAPSRAEIPRYRQLLLEVEAEAARINARLGSRRGAPIVLLKRHHSHAQIRAFYRAADVCMVTSLHDGMNLVAKEFVAAREDERGALILSRFTGAARELRDALVVNPYDVNEMAEALRGALEMDLSEQAMRMVRMRAALRENNIYFWAGNLISELAAVRVRSPAMR